MERYGCRASGFQYCAFMLAGSEVPLENNVGAGGQAVAEDGEHHRETGIAELTWALAVGGAQHVEERFFDGVLVNERHGEVPG